jgi:hypothetical protein
MRTVRTTSSDGPRATRAARIVRDVRAGGPPNTLRSKTPGQRIETKALKNTRRTRKTPGRNPPRGQSASTPRTVRQAQEQQAEPETETTKFPTRPWISQTVEALEERFGEDVKRP